MKKIMILAVVAVAAVTSTFARPHHGGHHGGYRYHGGFHHHHHGSWWGRGGRNFWPAFAGGVVGGMIGGGWCYRGAVVAPAVVPAATVVPATTTVVAPVQPVGTSVPVTVPVSSQPYQYVPLDTVVRPVEAYQQVWVPGQLVPVTNPDGSVSYVRQPGHYERVRIQ